MEIVSLPVTIDDGPPIARLKALRVNGKAVSLASFRQWPTMELIDRETPKLLAMPIGWVNYTWKDCEPGETNFVIESRSVLYRCPVLIRWSDQRFRGPWESLTPPGHDRSEQWCERWDQIMATLEDVQQLYIAV